MAPLQKLVVALFIVGIAAQRPSNEQYKADKAAAAKTAATAEAKDSKLAAVNKVVSMLQDLQKQVLAEGEKEAKTYNTFACWAKTTQGDKSDAVKKGRDDKSSLSAAITKLSSTRKGLDTTMGDLQKDITKINDAMKAATAENKKGLTQHATNSADLSSALNSLNGAIKELKASKKPSLLQMQGISKTVEAAVVMADALGLKTNTALLQDVPVEMENYKFKSGSIISTLESLLTEFRSEKNKVDAAEVERVKTFQSLMQEHTDEVKSKTTRLGDSQKAQSKASADIAETNQELSTVSANLLDDLSYLSEVNTISSQKAKTWDQRSKVRADELSALTAAITIVQDTVAGKTSGATMRFAQLGVSVRMADAVATSEDSMEAIEQSAEEAEGSSAFLQRRVSRHAPSNAHAAEEARDKIVALFKKDKKSPLLLNLASQVASAGSADVFAKIKTLIQELVTRLLSEAANEATHHGWCSKAMADAEQKRETAGQEVGTLNAQLAQEEARHDKLAEDISELTAEIAKEQTGQDDAEKRRGEEKEENKNTVTEANAGLSAVQQAIQILNRFYATAAKAKVDAAFIQSVQPKKDMPDAGFESGEAYTGAGDAAGGVVGMLEVIEGDFVRTIKETEKGEAQAVQDHLEFMTVSGKSLAEKQVAKTQTGKYKDENDQKLEADRESLKTQVSVLQTSIKELLELKPACVDTGMSAADRVAKREEEVSSLKKALCILNAYASFGPSGLADQC